MYFAINLLLTINTQISYLEKTTIMSQKQKKLP